MQGPLVIKDEWIQLGVWPEQEEAVIDLTAWLHAAAHALIAAIHNTSLQSFLLLRFFGALSLYFIFKYNKSSFSFWLHEM